MKLKFQTRDVILMFVMLWVIIVLWRLMVVMNSKPLANSQQAVGDEACPPGKVCIDANDYDMMMRQQVTKSVVPPSYTRDRDMRVLNDPLYPALNRSDRDSFEGVIDNTIKRNFNMPTQFNNDTFRLVGYLTTEEDDYGKTWKLMGRQKDRNRGEFYMIPTNNNYDVKVQITDDIVVGDKLRHLDTIPNEIEFKSPILAETPYKFVELPKADLGGGYF